MEFTAAAPLIFLLDALLPEDLLTGGFHPLDYGEGEGECEFEFVRYEGVVGARANATQKRKRSRETYRD